MNEPVLAKAAQQAAPTVYGMPAHGDRAAAVGELHARPYLLIAGPRTLLQFAVMTEGDLSRDYAAMDSLSDRLGIAPQAHASPLHDLKSGEEDRHGEILRGAPGIGKRNLGRGSPGNQQSSREWRRQPGDPLHDE